MQKRALWRGKVNNGNSFDQSKIQGLFNRGCSPLMPREIGNLQGEAYSLATSLPSHPKGSCLKRQALDVNYNPAGSAVRSVNDYNP